jgi:hypothetical protein
MGNTWRTWETSLRTYENMMGTQMSFKKFYAHTPSSPKEKSCMSVISMVVAILLLELIPLSKSVGTY